MKPLRFYEHFAVAFGTLWLAVITLAVCTGTHINTGLYGLIGFPVISLGYAFWKRSKEQSDADLDRFLRRDE